MTDSKFTMIGILATDWSRRSLSDLVPPFCLPTFLDKLPDAVSQPVQLSALPRDECGVTPETPKG